MATENILMACVKKGSDRQEMHEILRKFSQEVGDNIKQNGAENDLLERLALSDEVPLSAKEIKEIVDPRKFIGTAPEQVTAFLKNEIYPYLAQQES